MNLIGIYQKLLKHFGKQHWWPAETRFEVIVGAILTQQTTWKSVETAIQNLKERDLLNPQSLANVSLEQVENLIRVTGFFRQKARRITNFSQYLVNNYDGSLDRLFEGSTDEIRRDLLSLEGIGSETADSILLYVANRLVFPIDAYTIRICKRLGIEDCKYNVLKYQFERNLPEDLEVYKESHALIDKLGKTYCKTKPICSKCPLADNCSYKMLQRL